jgi:recombination protein RecT
MNIVNQREERLKGLIVPRQKMLESLLGDPARSKKFMATLLAAGMDPALARCTPESVVEAGLAAAALKLSPGKELGQAYLIAYANSCQLQIGVKGYISLLARIGWHIKAHPVYDTDAFTYTIDGWEERVEFCPDYEARGAGADWEYQHLRGVLTLVKSRDGELFTQFVPRSVIERMRLASPNQKDPQRPTGVWRDWYEQMALKASIKRHIRKLPIGDDEVGAALGIDDIAERGGRPDYSRFAREGVTVEAVEALPQEAAEAPRPPRSLNERLLAKAGPESRGEAPVEEAVVETERGEAPQAEAEPDPVSTLVSKLMRRKVKRSVAMAYAREHEAAVSSLLEDPGALDAVAEELRGK